MGPPLAAACSLAIIGTSEAPKSTCWGADRGDSRASAHGGIADGHAGVLLLVGGEGNGEEWRVERRPGPGEGGFSPPGMMLAAAHRGCRFAYTTMATLPLA
jgi:hypothetical protein